ncbi:MAG: acyltransferase family protein, partial [Steroidobacteraceae bacterium]
MQQERIVSVDAVRAVFILLGVVYHAAQPYESHAWIISDPAYSPVLAGIAFALHEFRMPGFFMLSGFLAALAYRKYGARTLLTRRLVRLGVPLLFGLLTIVPLQNALTAWLQHVQCSPGQPCGVRVSHGFAVSHLWFLAYLLLFVAALPATFELLRRAQRIFARHAHAPRILVQLHAASWLAPALLGLSVLAGCVAILHGIAHFAHGLYREWLGFFIPYDALRLFGWFALGIGCAVSAMQANAWFHERPARSASVVSIVLGLLVCVAVARQFTEVAGSLLNVVAEAAVTFGAGMLLFGGMHLFGDLYEAAPALFARLSDASYTIYLVHHPIVIGLAGAMLGLRWSPHVKFTVIVVLTSALSWWFHEGVVRRVPWLRFALNGTW